MPRPVAEIPEHALKRLEGLRTKKNPNGIFTSDFSVNEFLMVRKAGFEPIGLCLGSCVYHVGIQYSSWSQNQELPVLTRAMYEARELAMSRMEAEAADMGADGVVGVRLEIRRFGFDSDILEFTTIGTGVVHRERQGEFRRGDGLPFTSDLSGQEFWTLLQAGYRPVSLAMGSCVYHVGRRGIIQTLKSVARNTELTNYSAALYDARENAMERMQHEAVEVGAAGVVGMKVTANNHNWESHVIEYFAVGTSVLPLEGAHEANLPDPTLVLSVGT